MFQVAVCRLTHLNIFPKGNKIANLENRVQHFPTYTSMQIISFNLQLLDTFLSLLLLLLLLSLSL